MGPHLGLPISPSVLFALQVAIIIGLAPTIWYLTPIRRVLPLAVLQILVGIALGPSLLGRISPPAMQALFPAGSLPALGAIADAAIVLFALTIGLHLDLSILLQRGRGFARVCTGSIVLPVLLGVACGLWIALMFPEAVGLHASTLRFACGMGICFGVTALPVLASILSDMGLIGSRLGQMALACATVSDIALWCLLAALLAFGAETEGGGSLMTLGIGAGAYVLAMLGVVRPLLGYLAARVPSVELQLVLAGTTAFVSAACTELLKLHVVIGALLAGNIIPAAWRPAIVARLETVTGVILLPFFFAITGLRTTIDFGSSVFVGVLGISCLAAISGKVIGTALPARLVGYDWREAVALGSLLQAKGLMEVVALSVLLDADIIAPATFSAMIVMAVVTTALSAPLARVSLYQRPPLLLDRDVKERTIS